jgi:putative spermidine/putrescine transport system substrate-binding protein
MRSSSRRRIYAALGAAALGLLLTVSATASGSSSGGSSSGGKLVFATYGGSYTDAQNKAFFRPCAKQVGYSPILDNTAGTAKLKAMVRSGHVRWDVIDADGVTLNNDVASGLLSPLDFKAINTSNIPKSLVSKYGVGYLEYSENFGWSKDAFPGQKLTPADFFNPDIKARRYLDAEPENSLEFALLADGVPPSQLYPLDVDRAFKVLDRIKSQLVAEKSQPETLVQQKEIDMAFMPGGRLLNTIAAGSNWQLSWQDAVSDVAYWAVAKNAPHKATAMKFINCAIQAAHQAALSKIIPYGPTNSKAIRLLDPSLASKLSTYPANAKQGVTLNAAWWAKNINAVQPRWDALLAG